MAQHDRSPQQLQIDIPPLDMSHDQSESPPDSASSIVTPAISTRPSVVKMIHEPLESTKLGARLDEAKKVNGVTTPRSRSPVGTNPASPRVSDTTPKARENKLPASVSPVDLTGSRERVVSPSRPSGMMEQQRAYLPRNINEADGDSPRTRSPFSTMPVNLPTNHAQDIAWPLSKADTRVEKAVAPEAFTDSQAYWLALYFFFNLGLTLFNKVVLVSFPFPYVSA